MPDATSQKLEKAYLSILPPGKGGGGAKKKIKFAFNPRDYTISKSANWSSVPQRGTKDGGEPQFTGAHGRSLDLEIFLDVTDSASASVTKDVEALFACCEPTSESLQKNQPSPPTVIFGWGSRVTFRAYVESVSAKFTMFRQSGEPVRATCSLKLSEIPSPTPGQNPTSGSLAVHRSHTMVVGDTLASVSYLEYGTPTLWRALAEANGIDDPQRVRAGTTLLVPPAREAKERA